MKISKRRLRQIIKEANPNEIDSQDMADAKRYAKDKTPQGMADYLGIGVEDWHRIRSELDDHYEDRFLEDQEQFVVAVPDEMFARINNIKRGDHQDHLYDIVDAIESGAADYTLDMLLKNIEDAEFEQRFNEGRTLIKEGNHAIEYARGYEDARDGFPQDSNDPWYVAGFEDYFVGIHDQYEALHQDGITNPPAKAGPMTDSRMSESRLRKLVRTILNEEAADCVKDYMRMGYSRSQAYKECEDYGDSGWRSSSRSRYRSSPRKTSYVGASANSDKIAAIKAVLEKKPNNFLQSILDQLENGRGLSSKQKGIVRKILLKQDPDSAKLFESVRKSTVK